MKTTKTLIMIAGLAATLTSATPAQAHKTYAYHGNDYATLGDSHWRLWACDQEYDGHRVRAQYYMYFDPASRYTNWDDPDSGCALKDLTGSLGVTAYRVCEEYVGCGNWKDEV